MPPVLLPAILAGWGPLLSVAVYCTHMPGDDMHVWLHVYM